MNELISVIHSDSSVLERAFFDKLNELCGGRLSISALNMVTPKAVDSAIKKNRIGQRVFIAVDGKWRYGFIDPSDPNFEKLGAHCQKEIIRLNEHPTILFCLAEGDEEGFRRFYRQDKELKNICADVYETGLTLDKSKDLVNALDIRKIVTTYPVYNGLACSLGWVK